MQCLFSIDIHVRGCCINGPAAGNMSLYNQNIIICLLIVPFTQINKPRGQQQAINLVIVVENLL